MATFASSFAELKVGDKVTLKLREGESIIVGSVTEITPRGNKRVTLKNNANSVVLKPATNFRITVERDFTAAEVLDGLALGTVFDYANRFGNTVRFVKSGSDRYTRIGDDRPATSYSRAGFPSANASDVSVVY